MTPHRSDESRSPNRFGDSSLGRRTPSLLSQANGYAVTRRRDSFSAFEGRARAGTRTHTADTANSARDFAVRSIDAAGTGANSDPGYSPN